MEKRRKSDSPSELPVEQEVRPKVSPIPQVDPASQDRKTYNLFILYHASRALSGVMEVDEVLSLTLDMSTEVMNVEWGLFYLMSEEQDALELRKTRGISADKAPQSMPMVEGMSEWGKGKADAMPFRELRPEMLLVRSFPALMNILPLEPYYLVPMFHKLRFVGLMILGRRLDALEFSENDLELLSTIVSLSANTLLNAHLYELAILDGTTKLFVARYFRQRMKEEMKLARRYNQPLTLIMLDIDYFKLINDSYGHPAGDQVLTEVGRIIKSCTRDYVDIPCRYGGEEFAILLPETDQEGGYYVAERIRQTVEAAAPLKNDVKITLSGGVATYPMDAETEQVLVEKSDLALYEAKRAGRNQVVTYQQFQSRNPLT